MTLDLDLARRNMVSNQVRTWEVLDARVLEVLGTVHREDFVPPAFRGAAYADLELPLGHGEIMMKPVLEGRLLQALELTRNDRVLEIGTGSGYLSACLAQLAGHVTSIDLRAEFTAVAQTRLRAAGIDNAELLTAEAVHEFVPAQRFDAIAITGAVATLPQRWLGWLNPGGRLFLIMGQAPAMQALLLRHGDAQPETVEVLFETDLPYLRNAAPQAQFVL